MLNQDNLRERQRKQGVLGHQGLSFSIQAPKNKKETTNKAPAPEQ
jgi:hypothetical protein